MFLIFVECKVRPNLTVVPFTVLDTWNAFSWERRLLSYLHYLHSYTANLHSEVYWVTSVDHVDILRHHHVQGISGAHPR